MDLTCWLLAWCLFSQNLLSSSPAPQHAFFFTTFLFPEPYKLTWDTLLWGLFALKNKKKVCFYVSLPCLLKHKSIQFTSLWSISSLSWFLTRNTIPDNDGDWHKACLITINPTQTKGSVLPLVTLLCISAFHISLDSYFLNPVLFKIKQISPMIVKIGSYTGSQAKLKVNNLSKYAKWCMVDKRDSSENLEWSRWL